MLWVLGDSESGMNFHSYQGWSVHVRDGHGPPKCNSLSVHIRVCPPSQGYIQSVFLLAVDSALDVWCLEAMPRAVLHSPGKNCKNRKLVKWRREVEAMPKPVPEIERMYNEDPLGSNTSEVARQDSELQPWQRRYVDRNDKDPGILLYRMSTSKGSFPPWNPHVEQPPTYEHVAAP